MSSYDYQIVKFTPVVDTSMYTQSIIEGGRINQVTVEIPKDSALATDAIVCLQYVVKQVLTQIGTNRYLPASGTSIPGMLGNNVTQETIKMITIELSSLMGSALTELQSLQEKYPPDDGDSLITGMSLSNVSFDNGTGVLSVRISIQFANGVVPIIFDL